MNEIPTANGAAAGLPPTQAAAALPDPAHVASNTAAHPSAMTLFNQGPNDDSDNVSCCFFFIFIPVF